MNACVCMFLCVYVCVCVCVSSQTSGITRGSVVGETPHANAPGLRTDRSKLHVGLGRAEMSRADMFRATHGVAVTITQPVFPVQPVTGESRTSPHTLAWTHRTWQHTWAHHTCMEAG